ncbi:MAG: nitroreductase [Bacilli bacterium]|nr:nitroreductase [Bacilli bacterium]
MDKKLYSNIFKRKSFHLFRNIGNNHLTIDELKEIEDYFYTLTPLEEGIKVKIKITKDTSCKRGQEYCIVFYSELKDNYLRNIGYLGEQLDLYLVSKNIGTLWFGIGRPKEEVLDGLQFVIMIAIAKVDDETKFRKDMFKSKRKELADIWRGDYYQDIGNICRFAPSACNSQPWVVEASQKEIKVYRYKKAGKRGIMPVKMVDFYNSIDIGIFMCFLEQCLYHNGLDFKRKLVKEDNSSQELFLNAIYEIN